MMASSGHDVPETERRSTLDRLLTGLVEQADFVDVTVVERNYQGLGTHGRTDKTRTRRLPC